MAMTEENKKPQRKYSVKTIKVLFALSGNQCAEPTCTQAIIKSATTEADDLVVGQIAHIYALSVDGPRGKAGLTETERNSVSNLILLCPTHHVVVDGQYATYPAPLLIDWKNKHERKFAGPLTDSITTIGFAELEVAARALASTAESKNDGFVVTPPVEKIMKNGLGSSSMMLISMGAAKSKEVATVLLQAAQLDPDFPERLKSGFRNHYDEAIANGLASDELFAEMYNWAAGDSDDQVRIASGLCVLSHLFILCDVFER